MADDDDDEDMGTFLWGTNDKEYVAFTVEHGTPKCIQIRQLMGDPEKKLEALLSADTNSAISTQSTSSQSATDDTSLTCAHWFVWDAAMVFSKIMQDRTVFPEGHFEGKTVLELGAGASLVGMTAASLGAKRVVFTDLSHVLPFVRYNVSHNFPDPSPQVSIRRLRWGEPEALEEGRSYPDMVLASDIIYRTELHSCLHNTLVQLAGAQTEIYLAVQRGFKDPIREWLAVVSREKAFHCTMPFSFGATDINVTVGLNNEAESFEHTTDPVDVYKFVLLSNSDVSRTVDQYGTGTETTTGVAPGPGATTSNEALTHISPPPPPS